jgi:hypothetical protein
VHGSAQVRARMWEWMQARRAVLMELVDQTSCFLSLFVLLEINSRRAAYSAAAAGT